MISVCTICGSVCIGKLKNNTEEYDEDYKYDWYCQNKKCHRNKIPMSGYNYKKGDSGIDACVKPKVSYCTIQDNGNSVLVLSKEGKEFKRVNVNHL